MECNSFGTLAEGTLCFIDGDWFLQPLEGPAYSVHDMLSVWEGVHVRLVVANLDLLKGVEVGKELEYANGLSNQEISEKLKRRA